MDYTDKRPRTLGFIGARGGSKGLKNKNLLDFGGKPMIAWTIEAALRSRWIDEVLVSTDSPDIQKVAIECGARAPFLRPAVLAADSSDINDAILHALDWLEQNKEEYYDYLTLLQPTQPLRSTDLIDRICAFYFAEGHANASLVTVTAADPKAAYLMQPASDPSFIEFVIGQDRVSSNRQAMPRLFWPAGVLYISPVELFRTQRSFYGPRTLYFEVDERSATDIDTRQDFDLALQRLRNG